MVARIGFMAIVVIEQTLRCVEDFTPNARPCARDRPASSESGAGSVPVVGVVWCVKGSLMRADVAYSYVRDLLERVTGTRPGPDGDGDLPVTYQGARFYVRVMGEHDAWVQVFSVAVATLEPTPDLMEHLNAVNCDLRFARCFYVNNQVLIESEIWADDVNPANIQHACSNVAQATDSFAQGIRDRFGGRSPFEESKTDDYRIPLGFVGPAEYARMVAAAASREQTVAGSAGTGPSSGRAGTA